MSVSLTSWSTRSPIERPSLAATEVNATSGARQAIVAAPAPTTRRHRIGAGQRASPAFTASPASSRRTIIIRRSSPKSPATLSLASNGWSVFENASFDRAQAPTAPAAAAGAISTGRLRSRSGTRTNQASATSAAATSAPRDWVSRMARMQSPSPGYASARPVSLLVRLEPSQSRHGTASAAVVPTAFQY